MKVVIVASLAFSLVNFRGRLIEDIVDAGHEVVTCAPDDDPEVAERLAAMGAQYRRIPMARTGMNPFADARTLLALVRLFRRERPDLVLAYTQKPIVYAGLARRIAGIEHYFAMCSGLGHAFGEDANPTLRWLVAVLYRVALVGVRAVFVFNGDDHGEMLAHRMIAPGVPVVQVPGTGIDPVRFAAAPIPAGPPRFLMIARLLRSKGLFEFVEAARRVRAVHPDVRFKLLGPLDPNPAGITRAQVETWSLEGAVEYLGEVRDVRPYLAEASVFVLPSWYREGLPRSILEAMAMGRPVITTDMPGCREPITAGENGILVPARDDRALEAAMLRFVADPALAAGMGAAARRTAAERYSVQRVNDILLSTMRLRSAAPRGEPQRATAPVRDKATA